MYRRRNDISKNTQKALGMMVHLRITRVIELFQPRSRVFFRRGKTGEENGERTGFLGRFV